VIFHDNRHARKRERRLRNVITWIGVNRILKLFPLLGRGVWPDKHAVPAGFVGCFHHELVEIIQNVSPLIFFETNVRRNGRKNRLLTEIIFDDLRHVSVDDLVVGDAGSRSIRQCDVTRSVDIHDSSNSQQRVRSERLRIQEIVVDAAIEDIHALQAFGRAHHNQAISYNQVAAFNQFDPHEFREERMFEIGGVVNTWR
jgi:hypothetical protein